MKGAFGFRFFFSLAVAAAAGYALYASLHWPFRTALFPRVIALPLLALSVIETVLNAVGAGEKPNSRAVDFQMTAEVDPAIARGRTIAIFAWIVGFFLLIVLVGFPLGVPLFVFLYLKIAGREGWPLTLALTVFSWIFMEGLFDRLLHLPFGDGWIFSLFG